MSCGLFGLVGLVLSTLALAGPDDPPAPSVAGTHQLTPNAAQPRACAECHRFDPGLSHPVGMVPTMKTPADLPLEAGKLACTTCHEARPGHSSGRPAATVRAAGEAASLCAKCHELGTGTGAAHARAGTMPAHLPRGTLAAGTPGLLDSESRSCLSCHDGGAASETDAQPHGTGVGQTDQNHPVGVAYSRLRHSGTSEEIVLADAAALDPRVRLFGGTIGCGSCHSVYSGQKSLLVMSNTKSRLCLSCHVE